MGLKQEVFKRKQEFYDIFNNMPKNLLNFMTYDGEISFDDCIDSCLKAWIASRINGLALNKMDFYTENVDVMKLIDEIAKEYFANT